MPNANALEKAGGAKHWSSAGFHVAKMMRSYGIAPGLSNEAVFEAKSMFLGLQCTYPLPCHHLRDGLLEHVDVDGFDQMRVESGCKTALDVGVGSKAR